LGRTIYFTDEELDFLRKDVRITRRVSRGRSRYRGCNSSGAKALRAEMARLYRLSGSVLKKVGKKRP